MKSDVSTVGGSSLPSVSKVPSVFNSDDNPAVASTFIVFDFACVVFMYRFLRAKFEYLPRLANPIVTLDFCC